jgi:CRP-like cAMP-binding protein
LLAENVTGVTSPSEIDLRGLPFWDRPNLIREALDRLPAGTALTFITEHEPRGLSARITQEHPEHYIVETRRVGRGLWRVSITPRPGRSSERNPLAQFLAGCPAFHGLGVEVLEELTASAIPQTGRRGQALVAENSSWPFIGVVTEGIVVRAKGHDVDRERILYEIFPHEVFGVAEYFDRGLSNARIVAFSKTARIIKLPWDLVEEAAFRHPQLTTALGVVIAQRLREVNDTITAQGALPILARIARVLLPYAMPERGLVPASPSLSTITQSQIAAAAGTVKEVAARAIAELEARSALQRERGHIRYLDRQQLMELIRELS